MQMCLRKSQDTRRSDRSITEHELGTSAMKSACRYLGDVSVCSRDASLAQDLCYVRATVIRTAGGSRLDPLLPLENHYSESESSNSACTVAFPPLKSICLSGPRCGC